MKSPGFSLTKDSRFFKKKKTELFFQEKTETKTKQVSRDFEREKPLFV